MRRPICRAAPCTPPKPSEGRVIYHLLRLVTLPHLANHRFRTTLSVIGIAFLGSPVWQTQFPRNVIDIADELEFLSRPDSVLVSRRFAAREHLDLGGELRIVTPSGARALRVRGLLGDAPPARLFDGA